MILSFKTLFSLVATATLVISASPPVQAKTVGVAAHDPRIDQAVTALRAISTMRADFIQTDVNGQRVGGVMTLKRPGRVRFEYQKGVPLLIVSDGVALTMIDYEVAQVQRWPIRNSPLGALLSPDRDVAAYARLLPAVARDVTTIEVRDRKHPEYGVITMTFARNQAAPGGMELSNWIALDAQNRRTTVRLSNQRYGVAVPDATFRWRDPRTPLRH